MKILDVCCGSRMFYYDKESPLVTYMDIREGEVELSDGRKITVKPDIVGDFRRFRFTTRHTTWLSLTRPIYFEPGRALG